MELEEKLTHSQRRLNNLVRWVGIVAVATVGLAACSSADPGPGVEEDTFPTEPITVLIGNEPGGTLDLQFRAVQRFWEEELGQPLVPEYLAGGGGNIARNTLKAAPGDGYTMAVIGLEQFVFAVETGATEVSHEDFVWIGRQTYQPVTIIVRQDSPYQTIDELVEAAVDEPGSINMGLGSLASDKGLSLLLLQEQTGAEFNLIPFTGGNASRLALLAGDVEAVATNVFTASEMGDEVRTLGVHALENEFAGITDGAPTFNDALGIELDLAELGGSGSWYAPAGLASDYPERLKILEESLKRVLENPEFLESLGDRSGEVAYMGSADLTGFADDLALVIADRVDQLGSLGG